MLELGAGEFTLSDRFWNEVTKSDLQTNLDNKNLLKIDADAIDLPTAQYDLVVEFNQILSNLSARSIRFKVKINLVTIRKILKILKFRDSYFNADSVLGLMSPYTENSLEIHRHTLIKTGGFKSFD